MEEKVFKPMDDMIDLLISRGIDIPDATERDYAKLDKKLLILTKEQVLAEMGFPENWRELNTY